jgi:predicted GH43/DUF377 family glycosyl hydrolase
MKWQKLGKIFGANGKLAWNKSHAMLPVPLHLNDDLYRIYYSGRDDKNVSHIGAVTIDINSPENILEITRNPVLSPGELGCFDDNGVSPSSLLMLEDRLYLYYIGWKPRSTTRMSVVAGLAESIDGGISFSRVSRAPVLHRTDLEPHSIMTAPYVLKENEVFKMWYVSGIEWIHPNLPRYNIKYAESDNGKDWRQAGVVCIDHRDEKETSLARPCILKTPGGYQMWYSYKYDGNEYRIGYAESSDGLNWVRLDEKAGIEPSAEGWDSEMIEYAHVFQHKQKHYMLFNGNGYGLSGAGLARLE